jgi:tetratricopeptide (TPR) repeat protein
MPRLDEQVKQREIRVFVSSTFRDMAAERDYLVKHVFPQLRRLCESRGVAWCEVDLRWGVTDEQKAEGRVLPICLEEIKRCRPYFIGILGERYGWMPGELSQELLEQEPWLGDFREHSVTELEIIHGVLRDRDMHGHAFFYFRDPGYLNHLGPDDDWYDFESENSEAKIKLDRLKDKLRHARDEKVCRLRENFRDAQELGKWIFEDFTEIINRLFPEGSQLSPLDRDNLDHEMFALSRSRVYIGRDEYFNALDEHAAAKTQQPFLVTGESGSGKSALLANWALRWRGSNPGTLLIMHFIGATPYSADWAAMLRRIMAELKRSLHISGDIPDKPDGLRIAFANWLPMAAAQGRVVLILDALNQLEDREGAHDLVWLPSVIPENVRLFVSTLAGRPLDELTRRGVKPLTIKPLAPGERREYVQKYLAQYAKTLSPDRLERIALASQTQNPLFLKALLDELRLFGSHEYLDKWIARYLAAKNPAELYEKILARWEQDYGGDSDLVGDALSLIWASRRGLSESELLDMLGTNGQPLPRAVWSPLFLAAGDALVNRAGLITFFHDYLRYAVREVYLLNEEHRKRMHGKVAGYFIGKELGARKIEELPWQLAEAGEWGKLYAVLTDLPFLKMAWEKDHYDVKACFMKVEQIGKLKIVNGYCQVIQEPEKHKEYAWILGTLFYDTGHPEEALKLWTFLADYYWKIGDKSNLQACLGNQGLILKARGDFDGAMSLYKDQERFCRELGDKNGLQVSLGYQANIHYSRGDFDEAMRLYKEQERLCRELGNKDGLQAPLGNQGLILRARGDLDGAMSLYKEQERFCRESGNKDGLQASLGNQGLILRARGDLDGAMKLYKEQGWICRESGNKDGLQKSLGYQATIHYSRGDLDRALRLYREQGWLCRELGNKEGLASSLINRASLIGLSQNNPRAALPFADEALQIAQSCVYADLIKQSKEIRQQLLSKIAAAN